MNAPNTPESATPRTDAATISVSARIECGKPILHEAPVDDGSGEFVYTHDAKMIERDLRTALATAEARVKELEKDHAEFMEACALVEDFPPLMRLPEVIRSLTHQLTEAQAACAADRMALDIALAAVQLYQQGYEGQVEWDSVEHDITRAIEKTLGADLLKRLADAESHANDVEREKAKLAEELSRIQVEVKELLASLTHAQGSCSHEWFEGKCIHCEIKAADYRAARTQPKP